MAIVNPYKYLAGVTLTTGQLNNSCIKKGVVKKINSLQTVTVEIDSVVYENVAVWIHTDCGARLSVMKGVELSNPVDYFKNAALMFPLPKDITVYDKYESTYTTIDPEVFVIVYTDPDTFVKSALGVIQVVGSVTQEFPLSENPFRTYIPYLLFSARRISVISPIITSLQKWYLYDILNDKIADIPTYADGVPVLPFVEAQEIENSTGKKTYLDHFLSEALYIKCYFYGKTSEHKIGSSAGISSCYTEDGTEVLPGGTATTFNNWSTGGPRGTTFDCLCEFGGYEYNLYFCGAGEWTGYLSAYVDPVEPFAIKMNNSTTDFILLGRTYFGEYADIRFVSDITYDSEFEVIPSSGSYCDSISSYDYVQRENRNTTILADISCTVLGVSVSINDVPFMSLTGINDVHWTVSYQDTVAFDINIRREQYFDVKLKTPENFLWNCALYSIYRPSEATQNVNLTSTWPVTSSVYELEDIRILDNAVFNDDSLNKVYDGLSDTFALALRNFCLEEDFSGGAQRGIEIKGLYFVPFNIDVALLGDG